MKPFHRLQELVNVTTIVIIETLTDGQERVLAPCSNLVPIVYVETDQVVQEGLQ